MAADRFVEGGSLSIRIEPGQDAITISVRGEVDMANGHVLERELLRAERSDAQWIAVDLTGVDYIDSTGLNSLMAAAQRAEAAGHRFGVRRGSGRVAELLEMTAIDQVVNLLD